MDDKNWFKVIKYEDDLYVISEQYHWEMPNMYVLIGSKKALLIDTGLGVSNLKDVISKITNLPLIVVLTHAHWDHIGAISNFKHVFVHPLDQTSLVTFPISKQAVIHELVKNNPSFPKSFNPATYQIGSTTMSLTINDGDEIDLGNRVIKIIHTPGHSPGHVCLYDLTKAYLFTGDLVYKGKLDAFYPSTDPKQFYQSIQKLEKLKISAVFPGHYETPIDYQIITDISKAFSKLEKMTHQFKEKGVYHFDGFSIHI